MNTYVKQQTLRHHTVAQTGTFLSTRGLWSDMPPACDPDDLQTPWLSIKCNLGYPAQSGTSLRYETAQGGRYQLEPRNFLILNHNHSYRVEPYAEEAPQLLCVFFPPHWVEDVFHALVQSANYLLDNPVAATIQPINFFERIHAHDPLIAPHLKHIRQQVSNGIVGNKLEEHLRDLAAAMLHLQRNVYREAEKLSAVRAATREELYRRLYLAKDYMHACYGDRLTIAELAGVAALSPYHFLRSFKQLFHQTPHTYLSQLRLAKAQTLLVETDHSITHICFAVGFQSLPSFTNLFRRLMGVSPRAYRATNRARFDK